MSQNGIRTLGARAMPISVLHVQGFGYAHH